MKLRSVIDRYNELTNINNWISNHDKRGLLLLKNKKLDMVSKDEKRLLNYICSKDIEETPYQITIFNEDKTISKIIHLYITDEIEWDYETDILTTVYNNYTELEDVYDFSTIVIPKNIFTLNLDTSKFNNITDYLAIRNYYTSLYRRFIFCGKDIKILDNDAFLYLLPNVFADIFLTKVLKGYDFNDYYKYITVDRSDVNDFGRLFSNNTKCVIDRFYDFTTDVYEYADNKSGSIFDKEEVMNTIVFYYNKMRWII